MDDNFLKARRWFVVGVLMFVCFSLYLQPDPVIPGLTEKWGTFYGQF